MARWTNEHTYDDLIQAASRNYGVPMAVAQGLIAQESGFNARAYKAESGGRASVGLTQLLLGTARGLGYDGDQDGLYDPATNINLGIKYLAQQYARTGTWEAAYSAYNGGFNPARAMGAKATQPLRVVVNSLPLTYRDVAVGEFGNQPAVNQFLQKVKYFQGQARTGSGGGAGADASGGTASAGIAFLVAAAAAAALFLLRR